MASGGFFVQHGFSLGNGLRPQWALLSHDQVALGVVEEIPNSLGCWLGVDSPFEGPIEGWYAKEKLWLDSYVSFHGQSCLRDHGWILETAFSLYCMRQGLEKWCLFLDTSSKI